MENVKPIVEIDPSAGFCSGVKRAIKAAEDLLQDKEELNCLGDIVHNEAEIERLNKLGMSVLNKDKLKSLKADSQVMIRAHGEPPDTYKNLKEIRAKVTDATCPVVTRLQLKVKQASDEMNGVNGLVVIFGKPGHPEVLGLLGNTDGNAVVVSAKEQLNTIDVTRPLRIFAQTTADIAAYNTFCDEIIVRAENATGIKPDIEINQSICLQVSRRGPGIEKFARSHDVIIFVSGSESSNGKYLSGISKSVNPQTYIITGIGQIKKGWLTEAASIGISGATSTPEWLMKQIAEEIKAMF